MLSLRRITHAVVASAPSSDQEKKDETNLSIQIYFVICKKKSRETRLIISSDCKHAAEVDCARHRCWHPARHFILLPGGANGIGLRVQRIQPRSAHPFQAEHSKVLEQGGAAVQGQATSQGHVHQARRSPGSPPCCRGGRGCPSRLEVRHPLHVRLPRRTRPLERRLRGSCDLHPDRGAQEDEEGSAHRHRCPGGEALLLCSPLRTVLVCLLSTVDCEPEEQEKEKVALHLLLLPTSSSSFFFFIIFFMLGLQAVRVAASVEGAAREGDPHVLREEVRRVEHLTRGEVVERRLGVGVEHEEEHALAHLLDVDGRREVLAQDVQADAALVVDVGVVDGCEALDVGPAEGVVGRHVNAEDEAAAGPEAATRSHHQVKAEQVVVQGRRRR